MKLLDLFCGAGGCSVGYARAGFEVVGVDIEPHGDYPFELTVADAMEVARDLDYLAGFDVVHASPPCPRYSTVTPVEARDRHPDFVPVMRDLLAKWGGVWVMENVVGAPMPSAVVLCGRSFGLKVARHRLFEASHFVMSPGCACGGGAPIGVYGNPDPLGGERRRPGGGSRGRKATGVAEAQDAMGIDWMTDWDDLTDAIPPAYTEYLGHQLAAHVRVAA